MPADDDGAAADPLLLNQESQESFGDQILRNLLVERAITTTEQARVRLNVQDSRDAFKQVQPLPGGPPGDSLKARYAQSLRERDELSGADFDALKRFTMVSRGELTANRVSTRARSRAYPTHEGALRRDGEARPQSPLAQRLRIAAIGYRVAISKLPESGYLDEVLAPRRPSREKIDLAGLSEHATVNKLRRTKTPDPQNAQWLESVAQHIHAALKRESHIVLLPEFALPPASVAPDDIVEDHIVDRIAERIVEVARPFTHPFFLFSGSRHEGLHNRGFVLMRPPSADLSTIWWHYKLTSARSLGENVMAPHNAKIPSYEFVFSSPVNPRQLIEFQIFIAICVDLFDTTTFINYVAGCAVANARKYNTFILVPSFNPSREFVAALRDLSFIAECPVLYVNALHGDAELFLYGMAVEDFLEAYSDGAGRPPPPATTPPIEKTLSSLDGTHTSLEDQVHDATERLRRLQDMRTDNVYDDLIASLIDDKLGATEAEVEKLRVRVDALQVLANELRRLRDRGALTNLITVEDCAHCENAGHRHIPYCLTDVQYFNLDIELMAALQRFREKYFVDDGFLPKPFRREERKQVRSRMQNRNDRRARARR